MATKKNKDKVIKGKDKKKYTIHRLWCYDNIYFGIPKRANKKDTHTIVIHNTGGSQDKAVNTANYFKNNKGRYAGAHFVIDESGTIYQCARLKDVCYAVGGVYTKQKGGSKYLNKVTNYNSISIELNGIIDNEPTKKQIASVKAICDYIKKYRKIDKIIRHFDVNSKICPQRYAGALTSKKGKAWTKFKKKIS